MRMAVLKVCFNKNLAIKQISGFSLITGLMEVTK